MAMPKPTCRICNRQMTYSRDADWDAAYWICDTEHTRNGISISTAIAHEDAQADYIAQLEAENARLQARVTGMETMLAMLDNPDMAGMAWDAIEVLKLDSYPETDYQAVRKLLELGYVYSEDAAIVSYLGCGAWMKSE